MTDVHDRLRAAAKRATNHELLTDAADENESLRTQLGEPEAENGRVRDEAERALSCVVCAGTLLPKKSEPPHCMDCFPSDDDYCDWEERIRAEREGGERGD